MSTELRSSVVIPAFNAAPFLAEAIRSVLNQTTPLHEIIVVDDGSTDETGQIARSFGRVTVVETPRIGPGPARNAGVAVAQGDLLAFLDADDGWLPHAIETQLRHLTIDSDIVCGAVVEIPQRDWDLSHMTRSVSRHQATSGILIGATSIRRRTWERVGGFDPALRAGEFIDWMARAQAAGMRVARHTEFVLARRLHENNYGIRERGAYADAYLGLVARHLARTRQVAEPDCE